jgi:tRNA-dihydrouridine synthase B
MAGITDEPFRKLAVEHGAALAVSEMVSANPLLRNSRKSLWRQQHTAEAGIRSVQIVGTEPEIMAASASYNVSQGAQIIDINMGCPAKKVCRKAAGSALMRDERKVAEILKAVVSAVDVPVTLKIRTGWSLEERNAITIARIAESEGISLLAVHGRTRACAFRGEAEYETVARVKQSVSMPVIANGDINSPQTAKSVLDFTQADGVMIGRAAQGNPWLIRDIHQFLRYGSRPMAPSVMQITDTMRRHMEDIYALYGGISGARMARKHAGWYCRLIPDGEHLRTRFNSLDQAGDQIMELDRYRDQYRERQTGLAA